MKRLFLLMLLPALNLFAADYHVARLADTVSVVLDGRLSEDLWKDVPALSSLTMVEPVEGAAPSQKTLVKIAATSTTLYVGVICYDTHPDRIITISKTRDAEMDDEDHIKFVFDTFRDGRSGYVFAVNPFGARYDALVAKNGEGENNDWDALWDARAVRTANGWSMEAAIPVYTLSFPEKSPAWGFNIQRRIQSEQETDRWAGARQDYGLSQVVHAAPLTGLPEFDLGLGLTLRGALIGSMRKSYGGEPSPEVIYSADITQRVTSNVSAQLTLNTDFAETEVDARRTNLTRFPLFFPEKRSFFVEGSDVFDFGLGLRRDIIPFFSRRIGLYEGAKIPIDVGAKLNGTLGGTRFGGLLTLTGRVEGVAPARWLGAFRIRQNFLEESYMGLLGTIGDPVSCVNSWMLGGDVTYKTSRMFGDKNFLTGLWALYNHNPSLGDDNSAFGLKIDYPNDLWDISITAKRIGSDFDPSLGFVPQRGIFAYSAGGSYRPRPSGSLVRQLFFESYARLVTGLDHNWEFYRWFTAPVNVRLESGDRFEFNIVPAGEVLPEPFEIEDGVVLQPGPYHWKRYRLELETASKRALNGQATWWFGSFYNGKLDQLELEMNMRPDPVMNIEVSFEKNIVHLPEGHFTQNLFGSRIQISFAPNFEFSSFIQYDSDSRQLGSNTRLRWTFDVLGDLFIVYNHNINRIERGYWQYDSNQLVIKLSYGGWF